MISKNRKNKIITKKASARKEKTCVFFKRYWYWFVTILILIGAILGWCGGMGYFDKPTTIVISIEDIYMMPMTYYKLNATAGKEEVNYYIDTKYSSIVSIENDIIYAKNQGEATVKVFAGNASKEIKVFIQAINEYWTVGIGDEIATSDLFGFAQQLQGNISYLSNSDYTIINNEDDANKYIAKKEGVSVFTLMSDGVTVSNIFISVKSDLNESEKIINTKVNIANNAPDFKKEPKIRKVKEYSIGEKGKESDLTFSGGGKIYFESSDSDIVKVYQNGEYECNKVGTCLLSACCFGENGGIDYYSIQIEVQPIYTVFSKVENEVSRNVRVGETITQNELYEIYGNELIDRLETDNTSYLEKTVLPSGEITFIAKRTTEQDKVIYIEGLTQEGTKIVRYAVIIDKEADSE